MIRYYYAELNDNNVCIRIISSTSKINDPKRYISIPDYNESLTYKKWSHETGWSMESYEPELDIFTQERLANLENKNYSLEQENIELKLALAELAESNELKITELQMDIAELAERGA